MQAERQKGGVTTNMNIFILTDVCCCEDNEIYVGTRVYKTREEAEQGLINGILSEFLTYYGKDNEVKTEEDMWEAFGKFDNPANFWIGDNHYSYIIHEHEV